MPDTSTTETTRPQAARGPFRRAIGFARAHRMATAAVAFVALGLLVFAIVWFQPHKLVVDTTVAEDLPPAATPGGGTEVLARGAFRGLDHDAAGDASLVEVDGKTYVRFEKNFRVLNGPDLVVYLSEHEASSGASTFARDFVLLGQLKGNQGSQNYRLADDVDLRAYRSVVVWCRRFNVGFAVAPLET
jgi:hypothetical protein